jgi:hypothetical protein
VRDEKKSEEGGRKTRTERERKPHLLQRDISTEKRRELQEG